MGPILVHIRGSKMEDYKKMYIKLFNGITEIIEKNSKGFNVHEIIEDLKKLQCEAEEMYIENDEA